MRRGFSLIDPEDTLYDVFHRVFLIYRHALTITADTDKCCLNNRRKPDFYHHPVARQTSHIDGMDESSTPVYRASPGNFTSILETRPYEKSLLATRDVLPKFTPPSRQRILKRGACVSAADPNIALAPRQKDRRGSGPVTHCHPGHFSHRIRPRHSQRRVDLLVIARLVVARLIDGPPRL